MQSPKHIPNIAVMVTLNFIADIEQLADHGISLPPNMQGLAEEQIEDLKLKDEWAEKCMPSGGHVLRKDDCGRRNGMGRLSLQYAWEQWACFLLGSTGAG